MLKRELNIILDYHVVKNLSQHNSAYFTDHIFGAGYARTHARTHALMHARTHARTQTKCQLPTTRRGRGGFKMILLSSYINTLFFFHLPYIHCCFTLLTNTLYDRSCRGTSAVPRHHHWLTPKSEATVWDSWTDLRERTSSWVCTVILPV